MPLDTLITVTVFHVRKATLTADLYACNSQFHVNGLILETRFDAKSNAWSLTVCWVQVKSVKPCLKQLQQCIQTISTLHDDEILPTNPAALFHWLPKEHMCVLVYLVRPYECSAEFPYSIFCTMQL